MSEKYNIAILDYFSSNIGDNIQTLAIRRFIDNIDFKVNREELPIIEFQKPTKIILNGWFTHRPDLWPIKSNKLKPLFISFHISDEKIVGASKDKMLSDDCIEYYKKHEPIGCRDEFTVNVLKNRGVNAYFSGCATLTFENPNLEKNDNVYLVDLLDIPEKFIPFENITRRTHNFSEYLNNKYEIASALLEEYSRARLVITSRLHCALPCISMGVPVVFVTKNMNDPRFSGYEDILNPVHPKDIILGNFDWDNLPNPNIDKVSKLKEGLEKRIKDFLDN